MKTPIIDDTAFVAQGAIVLGDVTLKANSSVWYQATLRGDRGSIVIGEGSNIQDGAVVHMDENYPVHVEANVTVGHGAIIHGCKIGENSLIGMGAIILNGAVIGKNCIIGAGALVTQNTIVPDNSMVIGSPAKVIRKVTPEEVISNTKNAKSYAEEAEEYKQTI